MAHKNIETKKTGLRSKCINPECDFPAVTGFPTCRWESCERYADERLGYECSQCGNDCAGLCDASQDSRFDW